MPIATRSSSARATAGVRAMVTIGEDIADSRDAIATAQRYGLSGAVGIHPHEAARRAAGHRSRADAAARRSPASSRSARPGSTTTTTAVRATCKMRVLRAQLRLARERATAGRLPPARRVRRLHAHPTRGMAPGDARRRALLHGHDRPSARYVDEFGLLLGNRRRPDLSQCATVRDAVCAVGAEPARARNRLPLSCTGSETRQTQRAVVRHPHRRAARRAARHCPLDELVARTDANARRLFEL